MTIEELKSQVGQQAKDIIVNGLGLQNKRDKYRCPNSAAHNNGDKNPSMAWHKEALQFHCFACGEKIDIYEYHRKYQGMDHQEIMKKYDDGSYEKSYSFDPVDDFNLVNEEEEKKKKNFALKELDQNQLKYLTEERGLSLETIKAFRLGSIKGNIGIPYRANDIITGMKIKNLSKTGPKYFSVTGSDFGLFHAGTLNFEDPLIITEGEFDAMAVYESGFQNVVSVGTGGSSLDKLLVEKREELQRFKALVVLGDNDEVGQKMKKRFLEEFQYLVKLPNIDTFKECKDMNDILLKFGRDQIQKVIQSAELKIEGLRDLDTAPYEGLGTIEGKYIPTGIPTIDYAINDLGPGQVTLITGRSNGGKSTFVNQILINAVDKGNRVMLVAGEGIQTLLINNIYKGVIGKDSQFYDRVRVNKRSFIEPKPFALEALRKWHSGKITIFSKGESKLKTTDELFNMINLEIKMKHPDLIIIDNLMSVLQVEKVEEKWSLQSDFLQRCCDISKSENVHIIIVLHPNKTVRKHSSMDFEDISGGSDIYNKADIILAVKRNYDEEKEGTGEIHVLKNRYFSDLPVVETHFQKSTGMLLEETEDGFIMDYALKWKQFIPKDKQLQLDLQAATISQADTNDLSDFYKPRKPRTYEKKKKKKDEAIDLYPAPKEAVKDNPFREGDAIGV